MDNFRYKISVDGQDCDQINDKVLAEIQAMVEECEDIALSFDEIWEKIDKIYLDDQGQVASYEWAL